MDLGDVAWAFVDAAGEHPRQDFVRKFAPGNGFAPQGSVERPFTVRNMFVKRAKDGVMVPNRLLSSRRPEGRKEAVEELLPEQDTWTVAQLCARLEIPLNQAERVSLGHILSELGWHNRRVDGRKAVYTKAGLNRTEVALFKVLDTQDSWTLPELSKLAGHENLRVLGSAMKRLGWVAKSTWTSRKDGHREFKTYVKETV